jgi:hypothetical protein
MDPSERKTNLQNYMASRQYAAAADNFEHTAVVLKKTGGVHAWLALIPYYSTK